MLFLFFKEYCRRWCILIKLYTVREGEKEKTISVFFRGFNLAWQEFEFLRFSSTSENKMKENCQKLMAINCVKMISIILKFDFRRFERNQNFYPEALSILVLCIAPSRGQCPPRQILMNFAFENCITYMIEINFQNSTIYWLLWTGLRVIAKPINVFSFYNLYRMVHVWN